MTWEKHFDLADQIAQVTEHAGIPRLRAAQLGAQLASAPLPRTTVARLLRQVHGECSGCPTCSAEMAQALRAFSAGDYETYCRWLTKQQDAELRRMRHAELRTNITYDGPLEQGAMKMTDRNAQYEPPDPYREGLARLRRGLPSTRWPEPPPVRPTAPGDATPPDPYREGLDKMRREQR